jgi:DNA-directed RNA polymerase specialized sigma24 family protein
MPVFCVVFRGRTDARTPEEKVDYCSDPKGVALFSQVISEMNERDREIISLFYLRQESAAEICSKMHITEEQLAALKERTRARYRELQNLQGRVRKNT